MEKLNLEAELTQSRKSLGLPHTAQFLILFWGDFLEFSF
jgi:hypothetical protein